MLQKEVVGHSLWTADLDLFEMYYERGQESQYCPDAKQETYIVVLNVNCF